MAKKFRTMRTFARTASKSMEKNLIENAKNLQKNPYQMLPRYDDKYSEKIFGKIKKTLEKIYRFKDDTKKLEKLSNKKGLDGALAGTLLLAHSGKAPYLGVAKFPTGDITYAQRGKADKEKLIAVQHFNNPVLRLLGIKDVCLKKGLHIYSWDDGYLSTGIEAKPPKDFINFIVKKTGFNFKKDVVTCGHISEENIRNMVSQKKYYLRINWKSAGIFFAICEDCAKNTKNTMFNITKYLLMPNIKSDFEINVIGEIFKKEKSQYETQFINDYLSGTLSDIDLIHKNKKQHEENIKETDEKILVLDGRSYGQDIQGFIKALKPRKYEEKPLEYILEQIDEPVVLKDVTPNKVLEIYWKQHGKDAINSVIDDIGMAEKFYQLRETPSEILELVSKYSERQMILSQLPAYRDLPPLASFADHIAKTYKTFGIKETLKEISKRPDNTKVKSVAYAFLLAFGKATDKKWKYSTVEIEYGEFLKDYVKKLLDSDPKNYHKLLQELLTASGSSENIENNLIK